MVILMISRIFVFIIYLIRNIKVKLLYGHRVVLQGIQRVGPSFKIYVSQGQIRLNRVRTQKNVYLSAAGGIINIGENTFINRNTIIVSKESVEIGKNTVIGPNVCIYDHNHKFSVSEVSLDKFKTGKIVIGENCWIGAGAIILKNTIIENGCVIGAGTIVSGHIPAHSIVTSDRKLLIEPIRE